MEGAITQADPSQICTLIQETLPGTLPKTNSVKRNDSFLNGVNGCNTTNDSGARNPSVAENGATLRVAAVNNLTDNSSVTAVTNTQSRCSSITTIFLSARIEIFWIIFMLADFMAGTPVKDVLLQKACRYSLHLNSTVCDNLDMFRSEKDRAEKIASIYSTLGDIITTIPSVAIAVFIGPWCDKYGYKTPLATATFAYMLRNLLTLATVYWMAMPLYMNIISTLLSGLGGGFPTVCTAIFSQATVETQAERRRIKFFLISLAISTVSPMSSYMGGQLYGAFGCETVLCTSFVVYMMAFLWALLAIRHLAKPGYAGDNARTKLRNLFRVENLSEGFKACLKPRPFKGKAQLWCLFGTTSCMLADTLCEYHYCLFYFR